MRRSTAALSRVTVSRFLRPADDTNPPSLAALRAKCEAASEDVARNYYLDWCQVQGYLIPYRVVRLRQELVAISEDPVGTLTPDSQTPAVWLRVFLAYFVMRWLVRGRRPDLDYDWPDANETEFTPAVKHA